ncbi:MAG: BatD family protein [Candidatus Omnitrophota bacterium]
MKNQNSKGKIFIACVFFCCLAVGLAIAQQEERLDATLERDSVSLGNPVYLYVTFYGSKNISPPNIPTVDGLRIKYVGPSTKISVINGRVSQSITHSYLVIPLEEGDFEIGPFSVKYNDEVYRANPVVLMARESPVPRLRRPSGKARRVSVSTEPAEPSVPYSGDRVFLAMEVEKKKMYINEIIPVTIKLYVSNLRLKDIEYPEFSHEGFSAGPYAEPQRSMAVVKGMRYDTLVFKRNIFGIKEGEYVLGPARIKCEVVERRQPSTRPSSRRSIFDDDFFSSMLGRFQTYPLQLKSKDIPVTILPFPEKGRPEGFQGAVGDFHMDAKAKPGKVKVGDPIVLQMIISGKGSLDTVTAPQLKGDDAFKTYEPQVSIKTGKKIYEQVIIPKTDEVSFLPEISFSFLNPKTGEYKTIKKDNIPIKVLERPEEEKAVKVISIPGMERAFYPPEELGEDIIHIKEKTGRFSRRGRFLYQNWLFWLGQVIPMGAFLVFYGVHREKEKIRRDKGYARFLRAPKEARKGIKKARSYLGKGKLEEFYDAVFRTLQEYLANKFNLPIGSVTLEIIDERFRPAGLDENILDMLRDVFLKCDMARYASGVVDGKEAREVLEKLRRVIDYLEKSRF